MAKPCLLASLQFQSECPWESSQKSSSLSLTTRSPTEQYRNPKLAGCSTDPPRFYTLTTWGRKRACLKKQERAEKKEAPYIPSGWEFAFTLYSGDTWTRFWDGGFIVTWTQACARGITCDESLWDCFELRTEKCARFLWLTWYSGSCVYLNSAAPSKNF